MNRSTQPITRTGGSRDGEFDPDAMLALVAEILQSFPLVRIVGHMNFPDAPRKISQQPGAVVCAYETSKCDGRQVIDLLRTHPVLSCDSHVTKI